MSNLRKGDTAMIVKPRICCGGGLHQLGRVFTVIGFGEHKEGDGSCPECYRSIRKYNAKEKPGSPGYDVRRLKRIPPLDELESHKQSADLGEAMKNLREVLLTR